MNLIKLIKNSDSSVTYVPETVANSEFFDGTPVTDLPTGAAPAHLARRVGKTYSPESTKRSLNLGQFGTAGSNALFATSIDFRPSTISHAEWISRGIRLVSKWCSDQVDGSNPFSGVADNMKLDYETESSLHQSYEGHGFWVATLATMEQQYYGTISPPSPGSRWTANIETSNLWLREAYSGGGYAGWGSHWPSWDSVSGSSIVLESQAGSSMTLADLFANAGLLAQETAVRRANRLSIMLKVAGRNGGLVAYGSAIYQGIPKSDNALSGSGRFLDDANADVSHIGGSGGTITLNGRTYTGLNVSFYTWETFHLDYFYYFDVTYQGANYDAEPDYPTLWSKLYDRHPLASEVGHRLAVEKRLRDVHGGNLIPIVRMHQLIYEGNTRTPLAFGLNGTFFDGGGPKVWIAPYFARLQNIAAHVMSGEDVFGNGYHVFNSEGAPNQGIVYNLDTQAWHNHHLHTVSALFAAIQDCETILAGLTGSTRTTDIDIKINNTGDWITVNGVTAYAYTSDGGQHTLLPCAVTRHKTTSQGLYVLLMIGMDQGWSDTRTDSVRIPGVGNGNTIKVTYQGRDVQLFEVLFPTGTTNTEFVAKSIVPAWMQAGYGGKVNFSS